MKTFFEVVLGVMVFAAGWFSGRHFGKFEGFRHAREVVQWLIRKAEDENPARKIGVGEVVRELSLQELGASENGFPGLRRADSTDRESVIARYVTKL